MSGPPASWGGRSELSQFVRVIGAKGREICWKGHGYLSLGSGQRSIALRTIRVALSFLFIELKNGSSISDEVARRIEKAGPNGVCVSLGVAKTIVPLALMMSCNEAIAGHIKLKFGNVSPVPAGFGR